MNRFFPIVFLTFMFLNIFAIGGAFAAGSEDGALLFQLNCSACHKDGGNFISPAATLKKKALERSGNFSTEAIINRVTNGRGRMPAFKGRLDEKQIEAIAAYVMEQAQKGW